MKSKYIVVKQQKWEDTDETFKGVNGRRGEKQQVIARGGLGKRELF